MTATNANPLHELEQAIMTRADELAREFELKADRQRDNILREAAERLHLAEEREVLVAKAEAERHYRRLTQASELKLQSRLDQLRWDMVQTVQDCLQGRMQGLRADRDRYRQWLVEIVREAAAKLPDAELVAEATAEDLAWLRDAWPDLISEAVPNRKIVLSEEPAGGAGGIKLRTHDNRAQVDNRFEGRMRRLEAGVQRTILQRLFPADINASARSGGPQ